MFLHFFGFKALFKSSRHVHKTLLVESFNQGGHFFLKNQDGSIQLNIGIFIKQNWIYNQKKVYHHIVLFKFNIKWGYFSIYYKNHLKLFLNAACRKRNMFTNTWIVHTSESLNLLTKTPFNSISYLLYTTLLNWLYYYFTNVKVLLFLFNYLKWL